jgi:hypothetical protein
LNFALQNRKEGDSRKDAKLAKLGEIEIYFPLRLGVLARENFLKWFCRTFKTEESKS